MAATAFFSSLDHINTATHLEGDGFTTMFGSMQVDLTRRPLAPGEHTLNLFAMFGSITVRVLAEIGVHLESGVLMGQSSHDWRTADDKPLPRSAAPEVDFATAPVRLRITATAIFGSVQVVRVLNTGQPEYDVEALPESSDEARAYEGDTRRIAVE